MMFRMMIMPSIIQNQPMANTGCPNQPHKGTKGQKKSLNCSLGWGRKPYMLDNKGIVALLWAVAFTKGKDAYNDLNRVIHMLSCMVGVIYFNLL